MKISEVNEKDLLLDGSHLFYKEEIIGYIDPTGTRNTYFLQVAHSEAEEVFTGSIRSAKIWLLAMYNTEKEAHALSDIMISVGK